MKILLIILSLLTACIVQAQIQPRIINPTDTDPSINTFNTKPFEHFIYLQDSVVKRNQLFVFIPGTNAPGGTGRFVNEEAARLGYHVISLIYPDSISMAMICIKSSDPNCYDNARETVVSGKNLTPELNISEPNSIINRLQKLVVYLSLKCPNENWDQFLDKGQLRWEKIALGGQSQGGGHAAFIAKQYKVARVLMFGSPKDYGDITGSATWIKKGSKTPNNRYFGFSHSEDEIGCSFEQQLEIFNFMGLTKFGSLINVEQVAYPYDNSRILTSTKPQTSPNMIPHSSVYRDTDYRPVWKYMLTAQVE